MIEVKVPELGESIQEVQVSQWLKQPGEWVEKDEDVVELESEKAAQALAAPQSGVLAEILFENGKFAQVGDVLARIDPSAKPTVAPTERTVGATSPVSEPALVVAPSVDRVPAPQQAAARPESDRFVMPSAQRLMHEQGVSADQVAASGPGGRILKEDVQRAEPSPTGSPHAVAGKITPADDPLEVREMTEPGPHFAAERSEQIKPMSMIRRTIAGRLVEAQQTAALLTTFNEIDMKPVMDLRRKYKEAFQEKHGVKLGFMSFFTKAAVEALGRFPAVNAEVRGNDVVSRNFIDIGIAIGSAKGLVVPILRSVEHLSFAQIERTIGEYANLAQSNKLKPADLEGGTFTISNGGVYGSLLSTPIVNPPQSGILGLHTIQERPVALDGEVVIRPMMYVALTYDHRIVDGREAVGFLKTIKEVLEEPARLFLEV